MPGTRAAIGGDGEIRTHTLLFTRQSLCQLELHRRTEWGTGREAGAPLRTPRSRDSLRSARMSHAPITANRIWRSELESNQPFGFFRPALIRLSYPTKGGLSSSPPSLLVVYPLHDVTIVVHIHEQVFAPFGSVLCIMTKRNALELHAQRRLRSKQWHACFFRGAIALPVVALDASRDDVQGRVITTTRTRQNVIES